MATFGKLQDKKTGRFVGQPRKKVVCVICGDVSFAYSSQRSKYCSRKCVNKDLSNILHGIKKPIFSDAHRDKIRQARLRQKDPRLGKRHTLESRKKMSIARRGRKLTKEHIRKSLMKRPMSSLEIKVQKVIDKYILPYKFVGNGMFFIENKNPDFININGEKKELIFSLNMAGK